MNQPGLTDILKNLDLYKDEVRMKMIRDSDIKILHAFINDGFIMLIHNPEHS